MIERVLGHLAAHGVDEAVLSLGYLPDAFMEAYPTGTVAGMRLTYAVEPEPLDTAGAVRFAATFAGIDETFVVVNGDVLTDLDLTAWWPSTASAAPRARSPSTRWPTRPPSASCPPTREGRVHRLRREAATRRGADQRDQRRHLRARAVGARPDPRGRPGLDRAGDLSRHGARRRALRALRRQLLARHGDPGGLPRGELRLPQPASAARSWLRAWSTGATGVLLEGESDVAGRGRRSRPSSSPAVSSSRAPGSSAASSGRGIGRLVRCAGRGLGAHGGLPRRGGRQGGRLRHGPAVHRRAAGRRAAGLRARRRRSGLVGDAGRRRAGRRARKAGHAHAGDGRRRVHRLQPGGPPARRGARGRRRRRLLDRLAVEPGRGPRQRGPGAHHPPSRHHARRPSSS